MRLTFPGTRGCIETRSKEHRRHSCLLIEHQGRRLLIDCGEDWLDELPQLAPDAILLTHAHPDHAFGLQRGSPCPVWATDATREAMRHYPVAGWRRLLPRQQLTIEGLRVEAFAVQHSLRAPAVGLRIGIAPVALFYAPDVVRIPERRQALAGCSLYIGDGASISTPMTRVEEGQTLGHTSIGDQLRWCAEEGVPAMIVTHCGEELVAGGATAARDIAALGGKYGVTTTVAGDGMTRRLD